VKQRQRARIQKRRHAYRALLLAQFDGLLFPRMPSNVILVHPELAHDLQHGDDAYLQALVTGEAWVRNGQVLDVRDLRIVEA
jgi:hypothetical protein